MIQPLLTVRGLTVSFPTTDALDRIETMAAVDGVDFELLPGRTLALVGESGSGKTVTALALMALIDPPGRIVSGSIRYRDRELMGVSEDELSSLRGDRMAMIFQEPHAALNPVLTIGRQVAEPLRIHRKLGAAQALRLAQARLADVGVPASGERLGAYPHELSGGLRQRVVIAMALACDPDIIIADEPTTALDVTLQVQLLALLRQFQRKSRASMLFITHDLSLLPRVADEVAVMYGGRIVERKPTSIFLAGPRHPYAQALLAACPRNHPRKSLLPTVPGAPPHFRQRTAGCIFRDRCGRAKDRCGVDPAPALKDGVACHHADT